MLTYQLFFFSDMRLLIKTQMVMMVSVLSSPAPNAPIDVRDNIHERMISFGKAQQASDTP